jgi:Predicted acyltransferases
MGSTDPDHSKGDTIFAVQYLRGFAALAVFLFHISSLTVVLWGPAAADVDHAGAAGVDLFFVISGFVMAMILSRPGPFSVRDFAIQRIARIVPGYYVMTIAVFVLALVAPALFITTSADPATLLRSLTFVPVADSQGSIAPLLVVGWTLDYEVFFYLLCAVGALLCGRRALVAVSGVIVALVLAGLLVTPEHPTLRFYTDTILLEFVYGIAIWRLHRSGALSDQKLPSALIFALGILLLAIQIEREPGAGRALVWGLPAAFILLGGLRVLDFEIRWLSLVGDWSYAFYLTHLFVIFGYVRLVMPLIGHFDLDWPFHYAAMTVLGLGFACLYHHVVEVPARKFIRGRFAGPRRSEARRAEDLPKLA